MDDVTCVIFEKRQRKQMLFHKLEERQREARSAFTKKNIAG